MDSSNAEKAWEEHAAQMYRAHPWIKPYAIRGRADFIVGYHARDAEVDALREQLAAAEAVLQRVRALCHTMDRGVGYRVSGDHSTWGEYHEGKSDFSGEVEALLDSVPASFDRWLQAHDREVAARTRDAALKEAAETVHAHRFDSNKHPILSRKLNAGVVHAESSVRALRSGTEGSTDGDGQ